MYTYNSKYVYIFFAISLQTPMRNSLVKVCFTEQSERSGCCEMLSMYTWRACRQMFYSKPVKIHSSQMNYRDKRTTLFDRKQAENGKIARTPPSLTISVIKGEVTPRVREITKFEDNVCSVQHRHKSFIKTTPEIN